MIKKAILKSFVLSILLLGFSCQDVVDVDLTTSKERLVIEALIKWETGTSGENQTIKLSKTASFYNNQIVSATGAVITVKNLSDLTEFLFTEIEDGMYQTTNFIPVFNTEYELTVTYQNETYKAVETLLPSPEIASVYQSTEEGFSADFPEVNLIFQDFENQSDYYRASFEYYKPANPDLTDYNLEDHFSFVFNDQFQENNPITLFYENEDLEVNDIVKIQLQSISKPFYNFLIKLEEQADSGFGLFSLPPVNVKGNIINTTNPENYPYGFFSLNEVQSEEYTFQ